METEMPKNTAVVSSHSSKRQKLIKRLAITLIVLLLASNGVMLWQILRYRHDKAMLTKDKQSLQSQVNDLKKQLADAKSAAAPSTTATTCNSTVSTSLKENIKAAITTMNTAALEGYMADSVNVVFAASEKSGAESPTAAIADLDYLKSATTPWNFDLPAATIAKYQAGAYKQYFDTGTYVGLSANNYVISFGFTCGKISSIFVSSSDILVL